MENELIYGVLIGEKSYFFFNIDRWFKRSEHLNRWISTVNWDLTVRWSGLLISKDLRSTWLLPSRHFFFLGEKRLGCVLGRSLASWFSLIRGLVHFLLADWAELGLTQIGFEWVAVKKRAWHYSFFLNYIKGVGQDFSGLEADGLVS